MATSRDDAGAGGGGDVDDGDGDGNDGFDIVAPRCWLARRDCINRARWLSLRRMDDWGLTGAEVAELAL